MGIISEFKEFAIKGNFLDLAVGVILGAASGEVVKTLVDKLITPPIGLVLGRVNFNELKIVLQQGVKSADGKEDVVKEVALGYGSVAQSLISFFLTAFVVFLLVRAYNRFRAKAPPAEQPAQEKLLAEIRDLLKSNAAASK